MLIEHLLSSIPYHEYFQAFLCRLCWIIDNCVRHRQILNCAEFFTIEIRIHRFFFSLCKDLISPLLTHQLTRREPISLESVERERLLLAKSEYEPLLTHILVFYVPLMDQSNVVFSHWCIVVKILVTVTVTQINQIFTFTRSFKMRWSLSGNSHTWVFSQFFLDQFHFVPIKSPKEQVNCLSMFANHLMKR